MNLSQLRKNVGCQLRVRPTPSRVDGWGAQLRPVDDLWRLDAVLDRPQRLRLVNTSTGHVVELQPDNIREYRSPDFLILRCQLRLGPGHVEIEPLVPLLARPGDASVTPVPRSHNVPRSYQLQLNGLRFRIAKDRASRVAEGHYVFPVAVTGRDHDVQAFIAATGRVEVDQVVLPQEGDGRVKFNATYSGDLTPTQLEGIAVEHGLRVIACGNPMVT